MIKLKHYLKKIDKQRLIGLVIILVITVIGVRLIISSHAQSPYASTTASSGTLTSPATIHPDSSTSSGSAVSFGIRNNSIYWGAWVHGADLCTANPPFDINTNINACDSPWITASQTQFESDAGKTASIIQFGNVGIQAIDTNALNIIWNHGSIPIYALQTPSGYSDASVANGSLDANFTTLADSIKAWGHPIFMRFDWEMNGNWFDWGTASGSPINNTAAQYVAMWEHVHQIFAKAGANNITWVFVPNIDLAGYGYTSITSLYPSGIDPINGRQYVDWMGMDAYGTYTTSAESVLGPTYNELQAIAPTKPILIAETGESQSAQKAGFITDEFTNAIPIQYPMIRAVLWYESEYNGPGCPANGASCYWIESSPSATAAFKSGIAGKEYISAGNQPTTSPIPAP